MAGVSQGPQAWWTLPQGGGRTGQQTLTSLQQNAPPGYEYDPVKMAYNRTPTSAGTRVGEFTNAALGGMGGAMSGLYSAAGMGGTGTTTSGAGAGGGGATITGGGAAIPDVGNIDTSAADAAAFGKAKDIAGQTGRASLDALRGALGETGGLGSGAEAQGTRDIIENAAGQLGDVNRSLAETKAGQALDIAKSNQATQLTERGQNIQAQEAQARLAQEYAQMQFNNMMAQQQRQLDLLRLALGAGTSAMSAGGSSSFLY